MVIKSHIDRHVCKSIPDKFRAGSRLTILWKMCTLALKRSSHFHLYFSRLSLGQLFLAQRCREIHTKYPPRSQGTNISPYQDTFEDEFPFPQVGYVSSQEVSRIRARKCIWKGENFDQRQTWMSCILSWGSVGCLGNLPFESVTLPETNLSPENTVGLPNRKFHLPTIHFQGQCYHGWSTYPPLTYPPQK